MSTIAINKYSDDIELKLNSKYGDYIRLSRFVRFDWPRSFYIFLPIGVLLKYLGAIINARWRRESWILRNAYDPRALYVFKDRLDEVFFNEYLKGTKFICKFIIYRYLVWIFAFVVFSSAMMVASFALFYLPAGATP